MTFIAPPYRKMVLLLQLFIVMLFSFCLYFFLHSIEEKKNLSDKLTNMATKRQQAVQIVDTIKTYRKIVNNDKVLREMTAEPTWEKVQFKWGNLEITELLARIHNLSNQKKIFVLESFTAGFAQLETNKAFVIDSETDKMDTKERFFHIQGYFLCP